MQTTFAKITALGFLL